MSSSCWNDAAIPSLLILATITNANNLQKIVVISSKPIHLTHKKVTATYTKDISTCIRPSMPHNPNTSIKYRFSLQTRPFHHNSKNLQRWATERIIIPTVFHYWFIKLKPSKDICDTLIKLSTCENSSDSYCVNIIITRQSPNAQTR
mgnify:CR=1 FL=1